MQCREVLEQLAAYADVEVLPRDLQVHVDACEDCRIELAEYRTLLAATRSMQSVAVETPSWLLPTLTSVVRDNAEARKASRERLAKLSDPKVITGGVLVAAGVAGALLFRGRRRRKRTFATRLRQSIAGA
ncbi:MAG TPA: hypothetical protein VND22_07310 [Actinomycetota bacterium]|nr:hypothetical protein [Actinomycetota bacterium]